MYRYFHFDLSYTHIPRGTTVSTPPTPCRLPWACLLSINQHLYIYIYTSISTYSFTSISISLYLLAIHTARDNSLDSADTVPPAFGFPPIYISISISIYLYICICICIYT